MNTWHTFASLLAELPNAQLELADTVRALVYNAAPSLFEALDFEDDHAFLEPALFAYFTAPEPAATLEQLLFGYVSAAGKPRRLRAYADAAGAIHLPRVGTLRAQTREAFCDVSWDEAEGRFFVDGCRDALPLSHPECVEGTGIQVAQISDPIWQRFFSDHWSRPDCRVSPVNYQAHLSALAGAFSMMRRETPALFDALHLVTRRIVLYNADQPNSFATMSAHGIAFLNVKDDVEEVFFADDLAHQCGHIMFNALTHDKERFLGRPASTPLRDCCADRDDPRTLYSAFHGLFTYSTILWILTACATRAASSERQRHEALGRIAFYLNKFTIDLEYLRAPGLLTADGGALYELFARVHDTVCQTYPCVTRDFDLSNQLYVFDYSRFAARNPLVREARASAAHSAGSGR